MGTCSWYIGWFDYCGAPSGRIFLFRVKTIITDIDYNKFTKRTFIDRIPFIGKGLSAWTTLGIYSNVFIEEWIEELLRKKVFIYLLIYRI